MSVLLGFYLGLHDSNVAVSIDGQIKYAKSERRTGIKHHRADLSFVTNICREWNIEAVDALCFSDGNRNGLGICPEGQLWCEVPPIPGLPTVPTFCIDHHYCHMLSAWPLVDLSNVHKAFAIDGRGDHGVRRCVVSYPGSSSPQIEYSDTNVTMGPLLEGIGRLMGLSCGEKWTPETIDVAGKIMGAHAYGRVDDAYIASVNLRHVRKNMEELVTALPWRGSVPIEDKAFFSFGNPSFRDWLASIHTIIDLEIVEFFHQHASAKDVIIYSGGCAQNVVCNETLFRQFPNLVIPPHCYDGGLSLGAIELLRSLRCEQPFQNDGFPYWQDDAERNLPSETVLARVVEILAKGGIVGWFQGQGEIGPRALGNRSILMNPTLKDGKDTLNSRVKHRESWRPFGATILENSTNEWVGQTLNSPYMLRAIKMEDSVCKAIPSVIHVDGTCRFQTVHDRQNPLFAELLERFNRLTGIPILLNTSLNGGGQPIFANADQCRLFKQKVDIDTIVVGDSFL